MLTFIHEAGWFSWLTVGTIAVGLVRLVMTFRSAGRSGPVAATWAAVAMALALVGMAGGQQKVDAAVQREADPAQQILMVSIGTLLAFVIVCAGVFVLRFTDPVTPRPFRTPAFWLICPLGVFFCGWLMYGLPRDTWARLLVWMAIGFAIYFTYGRRHARVSRFAQPPRS